MAKLLQKIKSRGPVDDDLRQGDVHPCEGIGSDHARIPADG